jgi:hypothetical protein
MPILLLSIPKQFMEQGVYEILVSDDGTMEIAVFWMRQTVVWCTSTSAHVPEECGSIVLFGTIGALIP